MEIYMFRSFLENDGIRIEQRGNVGLLGSHIKDLTLHELRH